MISMALSGLEILRFAPQELTAGDSQAGAASEPAPRRSLRKPRGILVEFRAPGSPVVRRLIYFSVDVPDASLAAHPAFLAFVRKRAPTSTLLKSASYLLHAREFSKLRAALLEVSRFLVQDDSGLPYKTLVSHGWQFRLHGTYTVPIPPFEGAFQPALQAAYRKQQPEPLPFDFGYHFNDRRDTRANVMVGRKVAQRALVSLNRAPRGLQLKTSNVRLR
jgi:hypothetical protein